MDANKISEIMNMYNEGHLSKMEAILLLITTAGCDSDAVIAVFSIYSKKDDNKSK